MTCYSRILSHQDASFGNLRGTYYSCIYEFNDMILRELWSDEGLTTTKDNSSDLTKCQSSHLTSFAVLVETQGASTSSVSKYSSYL